MGTQQVSGDPRVEGVQLTRPLKIFIQVPDTGHANGRRCGSATGSETRRGGVIWVDTPAVARRR